MSKQLLEEIRKADTERSLLQSQQHRLNKLEQIREDVCAIAVCYKRVQENAATLGIYVDINDLLAESSRMVEDYNESEYYQSS